MTPDASESDVVDYNLGHDSKKPRQEVHACPVSDCKTTFTRKSDLRRHNDTVHRPQNRHNCPFCCSCYTRADNLTSHVNEMHNGRNYVDLTKLDSRLVDKEQNEKMEDGRCLLACPFAKHNPEAYRENRGACSGPGFPSFARAKEHVKRVHMAKPKCPKCGSLFDKLESLMEHMQQTSPSFNMPLERSNGVTPKQEDELERRISKHMSEAEKWNTMYSVLFNCPSQSVPSPFQEASITQGDLDYALRGLGAHFQNTLPYRVDDSIRQLFPTPPAPELLHELSSAISFAVEDELNRYISDHKTVYRQVGGVRIGCARTFPAWSQEFVLETQPARVQSWTTDSGHEISLQSTTSALDGEPLPDFSSETTFAQTFSWAESTFDQALDPGAQQFTAIPEMNTIRAYSSQNGTNDQMYFGEDIPNHYPPLDEKSIRTNDQTCFKKAISTSYPPLIEDSFKTNDQTCFEHHLPGSCLPLTKHSIDYFLDPSYSDTYGSFASPDFNFHLLLPDGLHEYNHC